MVKVKRKPPKKPQKPVGLTDDDKDLLVSKGLEDHLEGWPAFRNGQKANNNLFSPLLNYYLHCHMSEYSAHTTAERVVSKTDTGRAAWIVGIITKFLPLFGEEDLKNPFDSRGRKQYRLLLPGRQRINKDEPAYHTFSIDPATSVLYPDPENGDDDDAKWSAGIKGVTNSVGIKKVSSVALWFYMPMTYHIHRMLPSGTAAVPIA